jgi:hypothetical protein
MAALLLAFILWLLATSKASEGNKLLEWIGLVWEVKKT